MSGLSPVEVEEGESILAKDNRFVTKDHKNLYVTIYNTKNTKIIF